MRPTSVPLEQIYVPIKLRKELDPAKLESLAEDILENGLKTPIQVRPDKGRYVLVTGLYRMNAMALLGEETVEALIVQPRRY
jgi:ParB-like chromosome segregation protein Spo0J